MRRWTIIISLIFPAFLILNAQDCSNNNSSVDSLYNSFGYAKTFDSAIIEPALLALQYYPELKNVKIEFRRKNISTLMAARPKMNFLFRPRKERIYVVLISTNQKNHSKRLITNMSKCAKVGIIGHEFAHIVSYTDKSNIQMLFFALKYVFTKKKIERETDLVAIQHGLGVQMLHFNRHIRKSKLASRKYLKRKTRYYMSIAEIEKIIQDKF